MRTSLTLSLVTTLTALAGCTATPTPASFALRTLVLPLDDSQFASPAGPNQLGKILHGVDAMLTPAGIDLQSFMDHEPMSATVEIASQQVVLHDHNTDQQAGITHFADHHLSAAAARLTMALPSLDGAEVTLTDAVLELDLASDQPWLVATLSGKLDRTQLRQALSPSLARLVNDHLRQEPGSTLSVQLLSLLDHGCGPSHDNDHNNDHNDNAAADADDGVIATCEVEAQPLLWSYLGDDDHDAIVAGVGLFAVKIR